jgi:hypothetical protein
MIRNTDKLRVHVVIEVSAMAIQSLVVHYKRVGDRQPGEACHVDTADKLGEMISKFLDENNFDSYVQNPGNYEKGPL